MPGVVGQQAMNFQTSQVGDGTSPWADPLSWDTIKIGGMAWWGKIKVRRARRRYKWDVKDTAGGEGATETYRGRRPEVFQIQFHMWTDLMWTNWKLFSNYLFNYSGARGIIAPVDVEYPSINAIGVHQIVCESLPAVDLDDEGQFLIADVEVREYFPPVPVNATKTPAGAAAVNTATPPGRVPNPAIVALQNKIQALQTQSANLGTPGGLP